MPVVEEQINLHSTMYLFQHILSMFDTASDVHLHSTMYLFQLNYARKHREDWKNLHSTMYLFQPVKNHYIQLQHPHLHSTMYLFQPQIFRSLISIRIIVALLSTKQTSIIFILTCSGNIWISTDKIRIVDLPVILQYYVPTVKA